MMQTYNIFKCQESASEELQRLIQSDRHSILIEGPEGCGKTYLAKKFAEDMNVQDFIVVEPTVAKIREAIEECSQIHNNIVICIENLDTGVIGASYTLLKFLEEPKSHVYILVTCRNVSKIPDTIISRSVCVTIGPPIDADVESYAKRKDSSKYQALKDTHLWSAVRTLKDVDLVLNLSIEQQVYIESLKDVYHSTDSIANWAWKLGHYDDNSETPIEYIIRYLLQFNDSAYLRRKGIDCIRDISSGRIASHAAVIRFLFEVKYGG